MKPVGLAMGVVALAAAGCSSGGSQTSSPPSLPAISSAASASSAPTASTPSTPSTPSAGNTYLNARFGFRAMVPVGFMAKPPPEDGDGRAYSSADGKATYTVSASLNAHGDSPASFLFLQKQNYTAEGYTITYASNVNGVVTVSGTKGSGLIYDREVVGTKIIDQLIWSYPVAAKPIYDPLLTATVANYQPGDLNNAR